MQKFLAIKRYLYPTEYRPTRQDVDSRVRDQKRTQEFHFSMLLMDQLLFTLYASQNC